MCVYISASHRISLNMDNSKSDTVRLELNTYLYKGKHLSIQSARAYSKKYVCNKKLK